MNYGGAYRNTPPRMVEQAAADADAARLHGLIDGLDDYLGRMRVSFVKEKDEKPDGR
jgi:hypothetical protein